VFRRVLHPFTSDDLSALSALAGPLGLAVENIRLAQRAEERCQELSTLLQVDRAFSAGLELNAVLQVAVNEAVRATGACQGVVFTVSQDADRFEPRVMQGLSERAMRQVQAASLLLTQGINGRAYRSRQIIRVDDVSSDPDYVALRRGTRVRSEMVIPLVHGEQVLGNIDLGSSRRAAFADADLSFLQTLADQAAALKTRGCMKRPCAAPKSWLRSTPWPLPSANPLTCKSRWTWRWTKRSRSLAWKPAPSAWWMKWRANW
jgi:GAF domain-containing protein